MDKMNRWGLATRCGDGNSRNVQRTKSDSLAGRRGFRSPGQRHGPLTSRQNFFLHCMFLFSVFDNDSSPCDLLRVNAHASDLYLVDQRRRIFIYRQQTLDDAIQENATNAPQKATPKARSRSWTRPRNEAQRSTMLLQCSRATISKDSLPSLERVTRTCKSVLCTTPGGPSGARRVRAASAKTPCSSHCSRGPDGACRWAVCLASARGPRVWIWECHRGTRPPETCAQRIWPCSGTHSRIRPRPKTRVVRVRKRWWTRTSS